MSEAGGDWLNDRLETTYREARAVLDSQQTAIQDIDNKAMYTNRVIVVFLGVIVAAAQIGGVAVFDDILLAVGGGLLFLSFVVGVGIYSVTDPFTGPNRRYLRGLVENDVDADTWDADLVYRMGDWIHGNHADIQFFTRLLVLEQAAMILGIAAVVLAVAL